MTTTIITRTDLPLPLIHRGKVREVFEVDETTLLIVASDRVSAFDVVLDQPVPHKGAVLTQVSAFWFERLGSVVEHHYLTADSGEILARLPELEPYRDALNGRSMLVRRTVPIMVECVVRGFLAGSAWEEYRRRGTLAGEPLPSGLVQSCELDPPIFSPATKSVEGHDENITFEDMAGRLGSGLACRLRDLSLELYGAGCDHARSRGLIIADTKFEFGLTREGKLLLIDEVLTPDSSRYWSEDRYQPGRGQESFDKQPLRDHLAALREQGQWNGEAPPPRLSDRVIEQMSSRYLRAHELITGRELSEVI